MNHQPLTPAQHLPQLARQLLITAALEDAGYRTEQRTRGLYIVRNHAYRMDFGTVLGLNQPYWSQN